MKELIIDIGKKRCFDYWIQHDSSVPNGRLYAAEDLDGEEFPGRFNFAITAETSKAYSTPGHLVLFLEGVKNEYVLKEEYPVFKINDLEGIEFAQSFMHNKVYDNFKLRFLNPEMNMLEFCREYRYLAPYATPNSAP